MLMRSHLIILSVVSLALFVVPAVADPFTITFTAGDVKDVMASYGDPLNNDDNIWGLWSVRAMPIVSSGGFDIFSGGVDDLTTLDYWTYAEPSAVDWPDPYGTEVAYFYLKPASEHYGVPAHDLYFIADQPATAFQSYAFNNADETWAGSGRSTYVGVCNADNPGDGCNPTNVLPDEASFSFSFNIDSRASLLGWQFLVDGSRYNKKPADPISSSLWIEDFYGGGGLENNYGNGYQVLFPVPEPATLVLVGLGLAALVVVRKRA